MIDILALIDRIGWDHRVVHREVWVAPCPFCQDGEGKVAKQLRAARGFSVNLDHGGYNCLACGAHGTVVDLEREFAPLAEVRPFPDRGHDRRAAPPKAPRTPADLPPVRSLSAAFAGAPHAVAHLKGRGFAKEAVAAWGLGYDGGRDAVSIPTVGRDGRLVGYKFRLLSPGEDGPRYVKTRGTPSELVGLHLFAHDAEARPVTVAEGELDAVALWQYGIRPVCAIPSGAGAFKVEWVAELRRHPQVYLAYDADEAGDAGARKAAEALGETRCRRIRPPEPHKDWAACLEAGVPEAEIRKAFAAGTPAWSPDCVVRAKDATDEMIGWMERDARLERVSSGICDLDRSLGGGLAPNDLTFVYGRTSHGKSTLALSILVNALTHGTPCLSLSGEYIEPHHMRLVAGQRLGRHAFRLGPGELRRRRREYDGLPLTILRSGRQYSAEETTRILRWASAEGIRLAVFDPVDWLVPDNPGSRDRYGDVAAFVRRMAEVVKSLDLHLIIVFPVNKAGRMAGQESQRHAAWNILRVERDEGGGDAVTAPVRVVVEKARRTGCVGRTLELLYLRDGARIVDSQDREGTGVPF